MTLKVYLNGGGNASQSLQMDRHLVGNNLIRRIAFFAHAGAPEDFSFQYADDWIQDHEVFEGSAYTEEQLRFNEATVGSSDCVFLSGGNTFRLLEKLRKNNAIEELSDYITSGKLFYGLSAGAIVLGRDISSAHFPPECDPNLNNLSNLSGLDLLAGYNVACHFSDEVRPSIDDAIDRDPSLKFVALAEDAGLYFDGQSFSSIGASDVHLYTSQHTIKLEPGESLEV